MRLFAALDLTDDARGAIAAEQKRIAGALGGNDQSALRFVRPEHIHLTLVFVGEVAEPRGVSIVEAMRPTSLSGPSVSSSAAWAHFRPTALRGYCGWASATGPSTRSSYSSASPGASRASALGPKAGCSGRT